MAVIKFTNSKANVKKIYDYITQPSKTEERLISGKDCMPESAVDEMMCVKGMYNKLNGRQYIHIVQSFDPKDELTHERANEIGVALAEYFDGFQAVIATHKDREHIHNHILLNSVNFKTGLKFQQSKTDMQRVKDYSDQLCLAHGLSIIEKPNAHTDMKRGEYQAAVKGESWKMDLVVTIDRIMAISKNKQEFISNMNRFGYEVKWTDERKNITYTTPDGQKCRDTKLHNEKYLKERMEDEFRKIEAEIINERENRSDDGGGAIETMVLPEFNINSTATTIPSTNERVETGDRGVGKTTVQPTTGNNEKRDRADGERPSIYQQLNRYKLEINRREDARKSAKQNRSYDVER